MKICGTEKSQIETLNHLVQSVSSFPFIFSTKVNKKKKGGGGNVKKICGNLIKINII